MHRRITITAAAVLTVAASSGAWAQNPQPAPPNVQQAPVAPPNAPNPPPEKIVPHGSGTMTPSNVDPGMVVNPPANAHGTMPVVPPPGTPGGNQRVVPK